MTKHVSYLPLVRLISALATGLLVGYLLVPLFFKILPFDFKRTGLIINTLKKEKGTAEVLLFGNSILMNGIDAKEVTKQTGRTVYNLSSTGQTYSEGYMYYQDIPSSVKIVVQFVTVDDLSSDDHLSSKMLSNFLLMGYHPAPQTEKVISDAFGPDLTKPFHKNEFITHFEGRWIATNYVNSSFRQILRKDLSLKHLEKEIYYPYSYNTKLDSAKMAAALKKNNPAKPLVSFKVDKSKYVLIDNAVKYFKSRGIEYRLCVMPVHPDLNNYTDKYFQSVELELANIRKKVPVIDFTHTLDRTLFIDHCHPDKKGALVLSQMLAKEL